MSSFKQQATPIVMMFFISALLIAGLAWWLGAPTPVREIELSTDTLPAPLVASALAAYQVSISNDMNPIAVLETSLGTIEIELFADQMPITAGNFANLIRDGFYDGILFHRVISGFMIQSGDPITKTAEVMRYGTGGPGYAIEDEHIAGNLLTNVRGTIAMANSGPNSGGSQFFINLVDNTNLDFDKVPLTSKHPVFGRVIAGMEVVDAIGQVETGRNDLPVEPVVITRATIK